MKKVRNLLAMTILLLGTTGCATTIDEGERGVRVELGKMNPNIVQPGFHFFNPFTEEILVYETRQIKEDGETVPLTKDQQDITLAYSVWYRVPEKNVTTLYSQYQGDPYHNLIEPQIQEAFRDVVAKYKAEEVIHNVEVVKAQAVDSVRKGVGDVVTVVDIPIRDINLPKSLAMAIESKQVMEQSALKKSYELDKEIKEAEITITRATAEAKAIKMQAEALRTSPELIKYKMVDVEMERAKKWDGKMPETVLSCDSNLLYNLK